MIIKSTCCQLTPHFSLAEFVHCDSNGHAEIQFDDNFIIFVLMLEEFRVWYNRPINITSGYRPPNYNKSVGGSSNSSHLRSLAIDFPLPEEFFGFSDDRKREFLSNVKDEWSSICAEYNACYQCNWYDTYLHLGIGNHDSFRDERSWK